MMNRIYIPCEAHDTLSAVSHITKVYRRVSSYKGVVHTMVRVYAALLQYQSVCW